MPSTFLPVPVRTFVRERECLKLLFMATVTLRDIRKVYPFNGDDAKKIKKGEELKTNLTVLEDGLLAVHDFNLEIADKEFIVLVGPSGAENPPPFV